MWRGRTSYTAVFCINMFITAKIPPPTKLLSLRWCFKVFILSCLYLSNLLNRDHEHCARIISMWREESFWFLTIRLHLWVLLLFYFLYRISPVACGGCSTKSLEGCMWNCSSSVLCLILVRYLPMFVLKMTLLVGGAADNTHLLWPWTFSKVQMTTECQMLMETE